MAKLWFGFEHVPRANNELNVFLKEVKKTVGDDSVYVYLDNVYDYKKATSQLMIKITDVGVMQKITKSPKLKKYKFTKTGDDFRTTELVNVKLYKSGGVRGTGKLPRKGESQKNPTTAEQESGTIFYFEKMIQRGKAPTLLEINNHIGFTFDNDWLWNFEQQWEVFKKNFGKLPTSTKIYLDSGKNESNVLLEIAKKLGLKDKKDNWNPADIWVFNGINKAAVTKATKEMKTLIEFNAWLSEMYDQKKIIGVSLKKISKGKKGKFAKVDVSDIPVIELEPKRVLFDAFQKNFVLETKGNVDGFQLRVGYKASSVNNERDIKIYLEGRQRGATVQLGGVSSALFPSLARKHGNIDIDRERKKIFSDPMKYIKDHLEKTVRHPAVQNKTSEFPESEVMIKSGAFLLLYLRIMIESKTRILSDCYYSATKMNDFSSVHCKLY